MVVMISDGSWPHFPPLRLGLPAPQPSRFETPPRPVFCWAPHLMNQEHIMFSNPTPREPRLMMSDDILSALTPPFHCASTLQPATPPQVVAFESWTISAPICLNCFTFAESRKPNFWTCVCVFTFSSFAFAFLIEMNFRWKSMFALWSLSPQRFHYHFYLSIVSWHYQKYWTILILVLCLLRVTLLVCSSYSSFASSLPFFSSWWQNDDDDFDYHSWKNNVVIALGTLPSFLT